MTHPKPIATRLEWCLSYMREEFTWTSSKSIRNISTPLWRHQERFSKLTTKMWFYQSPKERNVTSKSKVELIEHRKNSMNSKNIAKNQPHLWPQSYALICWDPRSMFTPKMGSSSTRLTTHNSKKTMVSQWKSQVMEPMSYLSKLLIS